MKNKTFKREYKEELTKLREESKKFGQKHPEIAPMLGEMSSDPDTERLLEGVAFLNAIIQKKLHDEFPEILYELINILYPHYLKPIPSMSVIEFSPDLSLDSTIIVKKSTGLRANAYNDIKCEFRTTWDIELSPLMMSSIEYEKLGEQNSCLTLGFYLERTLFSSVNLNVIDFYVADNISNSAMLTSLLNHDLEKIEIFSNGKKVTVLDNDCLQNLGFELDYELFPYANNSLSSYKLLQEYFLFPQKFMFFKLKNLEKLKNMIQDSFFQIKFSFNKHYNEIRNLSRDSIKLSCVPIINIFEDNCEPIKIQNLNSSFQITPSWKYRKEFRVYDVLDVTSMVQGQKDSVKYSAFDSFKKNKNLYKVHRKKSIINKNLEECYLEIFRVNEPSFYEVLSVTINATNGQIPEELGLGDICTPTQTSPTRCEFKNITLPTPMIESPIENDNLWFLISHATTNILNINDVQKLQKLLHFYIGENSKDKSKVESNKKKINSLSKFNISPSTYVYKGVLLRGSKLEISLSSDYFVNLADMKLFVDILHKFFTLNCSMNSYVELDSYDTITGERYICKPQIGVQNIL